MAEPIDAIRAIHNAFRNDLERIDDVMPAPAFAGVKELIKKAIGSDWDELMRRIPTL